MGSLPLGREGEAEWSLRAASPRPSGRPRASAAPPSQRPRSPQQRFCLGRDGHVTGASRDRSVGVLWLGGVDCALTQRPCGVRPVPCRKRAAGGARRPPELPAPRCGVAGPRAPGRQGCGCPEAATGGCAVVAARERPRACSGAGSGHPIRGQPEASGALR